MGPPVDWSVKLTVRGAMPLVTLALNAAVGGSTGGAIGTVVNDAPVVRLALNPDVAVTVSGSAATAAAGMVTATKHVIWPPAGTVAAATTVVSVGW